MADIPAVSVVIPLYNKGPYIARALTSVLAQTFQDFEVIVVDDGSTDDGAAVVRGVDDPRIRLIQQENQGVSAARNRGVKESKAEFIAFLDADDEWLSTHLEKLMTLSRTYQDAGLYITSYKICNTDDEYKFQMIKEIPPPPWEGYLTNYFAIVASCDMLISTSSVGLPKSAFFKVGMFNPAISIFEDSDLWNRIALEYNVVFSWDVGSIYHIGANNRAYNILNGTKTHPFIPTARKAMGDGNLSNEQRNQLSEYISHVEILRAANNIKVGNSKLGRKILLNCKTEKNQKRKYLWLFISLIPSPIFKRLYHAIS
jgi:glycosyltransferase involved in cell wall biosynthesis